MKKAILLTIVVLLFAGPAIAGPLKGPITFTPDGNGGFSIDCRLSQLGRCTGYTENGGITLIAASGAQIYGDFSYITHTEVMIDEVLPTYTGKVNFYLHTGTDRFEGMQPSSCSAACEYFTGGTYECYLDGNLW